MKSRLKGLLALVLSLVMVFALATNAWATVRIGNVELNQENSYSVKGANDQGTATYDSATNTLTLNNFTMVDDSHYEAIFSDQDLTLNLIGDNEITASYGSGAVVVSVTGKLAIEGTGSLTADGTYSGLSASSDVDISGGKVTAEGDVYGIISSTGNVTITGGEVEATGRDSGINANNITITGGTVTAGSATDDGSGSVIYNSAFGIKADSSISITGGTVTATGSDAIAIDEYNTTGTVTIAGDNTKVTANGENSGIYTEGSVTISSGKVTATAAENDSCGIYGGSTITIGTNGGTTSPTVEVGCATGLAATTVNIAGGSTVSIEAKNANNENAIDTTTLNMTGDYQWSTDNTNFTDSNTSKLTKEIAIGTAKLYIKPLSGSAPGNTNPYPPYIYNPTPTPEPEVTSPQTFDAGIGLYVTMSVLSATGSAWLAKKKD